MVGRDAEPDKSPRRREALDHVHLDRRVGAKQGAGGVEARGARADDCYTEGTRHKPIVNGRMVSAIPKQRPKEKE